MFYRAKHANLFLLNRGGNVMYQFRQGFLSLGCQFTDVGTGNFIDPNLCDEELANHMMIYKSTDLLGCAVGVTIEKYGQGSLTGKNAAGVTLDSYSQGLRGLFFACPPIYAGSSIANNENIWYEVMFGEVTYNGVTYSAGEMFRGVAGVTTTSGKSNAWFVYALPPSDCASNLDALFAEKHLMVGDEAKDYYKWNQAGGFVPRNDDGVNIGCDIADGIGYVR